MIKHPITVEDSIYMILVWELKSVEIVMSQFRKKWNNPPVIKNDRKNIEFG